MKPGAFIPDRDPAFYLLGKHRQPMAENVARYYIEECSAPGDLVIDPFAASPTTARAAVELGRRAIAVDSNPLVAFAVRVQSSLPQPREIKNALAKLGEIRKEDESLQAHVEELYATACASCGAAVTGDYFIHSLELNAPVEKVYRCPTCGLRRDPTNDDDRNRAAEIRPRGFHYHLLLERIAGTEGGHLPRLRDLLKLYTPRNLYALVSITLKLDAEIADEGTREILQACFVHALDSGTTLYSTPEGLPGRKTPELFVEMNIWRALETAASGLSEAPRMPEPAKSPVQVVDSSEPAFYVGQGSAHSLAGSLPSAAALALSSPARLDPLFWQLSYLWTRWTLGKAAGQSLEPLLEEERQRWGWYGNALTASLKETSRLLESKGRVVLCFPAGSHAMIEALCLAASPLYNLDSFTFRPSRGAGISTEFGAVRGDYRVMWSLGATGADVKAGREAAIKVRGDALIGSTAILSARGEPLTYSWVHHGALTQLASDGALAETMAAKLPLRDNPFLFLHHELEAGLKAGYARDFDHWGTSGKVLWVRRPNPREAVPLADRVESAVREIFANVAQIAQTDLEDQISERFPGLLTPEIELVEKCAAAYAEPVGEQWRKRDMDIGVELERAARVVSELGRRMNFQVRPADKGGPFDLLWRDEKVVPASSGGSVIEARVQEDSYGFIFRDRLDLRALVREPANPVHGLVVIPETRVELAREKLRRIPPFLKPLHEAGWDFLRLPFVQMLLDSPSVERAEFQLALGLDPPMAKGKEQMELF